MPNFQKKKKTEPTAAANKTVDLMWRKSSTACMLGLHLLIQNAALAPCKEAGWREQLSHYF